MKTETIVGCFVLGAIAIFFYLSFSIGSFRLDRDRYNPYRAYFDDIGGLEKKDPVKVAGVQVGWVEEIKLLPDGMAEVMFVVHRQNKIAKNAHALIRQEGLLGNKFLEIDPGDSQTGILLPGSALGFPTPAPASIGDVIHKFSDIASSIQAVATSLQAVIANQEGQNNLRDALSGFAQASDRIAKFSEIMERTIRQNEDNLNSTLGDMKIIMQDMRENLPSITADVHGVSVVLAKKALPSISEGIDSISKDFSELTSKVGNVSESIQEASISAKDGFKEIGGVFEKINTGQGLVGQLITKDEIYPDLRKTIAAIKDYTTQIQGLDIMIDMHSEYMIRDSKSKGYFELRMRPLNDYFYVLQLVSSQQGSIVRKDKIWNRYDQNGTKLIAPDIDDQYRFPYRIEKATRTKNDVLFGLQFGRIFNRLALRVGLFENTFGAGVDYYVPLRTNKFHWITTFEVFDTTGINRFDDRRPHLKWLNRVYFMRNLYTAFGVDDFISKRSASAFIGGGIRFNDRDLKYFLPSLPLGNVASLNK